ncbi:BRN1 [Candida pseudojiufengensis]|uniref:BRN1 n=1 Tax=Candida pseudojiufengensis TaxID=497109 RepID=UPI002224BA14|nr:BRN1 [Candida pseudojiufengensis]KAI5965951.1 BRN1 [Candida pseudojiufengensis]
MSAQVLPKKRSKSGSSRLPSLSSPVHTHTSSSRHTPQTNRIISNSSYNNHHAQHNNSNNSRNRILSNRSIQQSTRHVSRSLAQDDAEDDSLQENGGIGFNENKHQILSNFEEWIRMSTDNKINIKNSWQFALIDYFHDLNVIKDGDQINFQKASATLDGCVKIYSSRIDSAATDTGKLLSGLAAKPSDREELPEGENALNMSDNEDNEDEGKKKRKSNRVVETTLVDFESIRIKKLDQELAIDPLFKKALAEFDEGGAKSLLLNTLSIDSTGRVVFDATTNQVQQEQKNSTFKEDTSEVDISDLAKFIFNDNSQVPFEEKTICPSLHEFQSALEDVNKAKRILNDFNSKMAAQDELEPVEQDANDYDMDFDFDVPDDDIDLGGQSPEADQIGEKTDDVLNQTVMQNLFAEKSDAYIQSKTSTVLLDEDLMNYFDEKLKINWTGPEHWKVSAFKKANNIDQEPKKEKKPDSQQKKKKDTTIQFFDVPNQDEDILFKVHKDPNFINLKTKNILEIYDDEEFQELKEKNLLPDDIKFTSSRLVNLIQKPIVPIMYYPKKLKQLQSQSQQDHDIPADSNFFAEQYKEREALQREEEQNTSNGADDRERLANSFHQAEYEDFDNDFDGIDFNDALEPEVEQPVSQVTGIINRRKSEFVNFSRVAKRVDIKLLKDNLWEVIKLERYQQDDNDKSIDFDVVMNKVKQMYSIEQANDLSISFCFICALHLANEHGLTITSNEANDNLNIIF